MRMALSNILQDIAQVASDDGVYCLPPPVPLLVLRENGLESGGNETIPKTGGATGADIWLTVQQVADYLGITKSSVYRLALHVRSYKALGVGLRFLRDDLDAYIKGQGRAPLAEQFATSVRVDRPVARRLDNVEVLPGLTRDELKKRAGF